MKRIAWLVLGIGLLAVGSLSAKTQIGKDTVVTMDYTGKLKNGTVFDSSSRHGQPFTFIEGTGQIIPGLAKGLKGLEAGDRKTIVVPANEAYPYNKNMVITVQRSRLPKSMNVTVGAGVYSRGANGQVFQGHITKVQGNKVTIDFNPPIAGKELIFDVHILGVRKATPQEISGKVKPKPVIAKK